MDGPKGKGNALARLPDEAMLEILARAPFRSVCTSKCVAKAWRDLIDDPLNRGRLPQTLQGFFSIFLTWCSWEHFFVKYPASPVPLDIDPCFSFLTRLPEIKRLNLVDSCNGLLLFRHHPRSNPLDILGYFVCNPTTKHWAAVSVCACHRTKLQILESHTYLAFDPVVSHFRLIEFWNRGGDVHAYSSESGVWRHSQTDWNEQRQLKGYIKKYGYGQQTFVNGILHLMVSNWCGDQIVAVDVKGRIKRTIKMPAAAQGRLCSYIGQSQGRLHYINQDFDAHDYKMSFWVLQNYDTQEWVLKDVVSFLSLFRRMRVRKSKWDFVVIHPDRNVVFFAEKLNGLIAYDMDTNEVSVIATLRGNFTGKIVPYIPYFSESPALTNKN